MFSELFVVSLILWVFYLRKRSKKSKETNIPTLGPLFLFGNSLYFAFLTPSVPEIVIAFYVMQVYKGMAEIFRDKGIFLNRHGGRNVVSLFKAETVEPLLNSKTEIKKSGGYKPAKPFLGGGLVLNKGDKWRKNRKLLTPAFHFNILEDFLPVINIHSKVLIDKLSTHVNDVAFDLTPFVFLCTFDIILETSLGTRLNVQNNPSHPILISTNRILEIWMTRACTKNALFDVFFEYTSMAKENQYHISVLKNFTKQIIKEKKAFLNLSENNNEPARKGSLGNEQKIRRAFLDLLLRHQMNDKRSYTDDEIVGETNTFIGAGHDTTAVGTLWCVYLLGLYNDVQEKVFHELRSVLNDDKTCDITVDDLREMKYLECVMKETQRLYPSIPFISRKLSQDLQIGDMRVPKKSVVSVIIGALHRDPDIFPDPERFDPNRFLPENASGRHPYAYVPFSAGPRNCIGQKFAVMEEKVIIANIIRNFKVVSLDHRDKLNTIPLIVGKPSKEIRMKLLPRIYD